MKLLKISSLLLLLILAASCAKENKYLIEKGKVGLLTTTTTVADLESIFENDSLVFPMKNNSNNAFGLTNAITLFSKEGKKMLEIVPKTDNDSLSTLKSIQIFDSKFKTDKGLSLKSNFSDINANYMVNNIETTLSSATLFVDELNATIAIDKEDLGLSKFSTEKVSLNQIPETAKIKYFTIWFN